MAKWSQYIGVQIVIFSCIPVTSLLLGIRHLGLLESWELGAYDQMVRSRSDFYGESRRDKLKDKQSFSIEPAKAQSSSALPKPPVSAIKDIRPLDNRLLVVKVTEDDIQREGYPLPDATVNKLLVKLESYQPSVIGLNIYRPQQTNFGDGVKNKSDIIGVCKFSSLKDSEIPPPPNLIVENVGFNDLVPDSDRTMRRALLFAKSEDKKCNTGYSFASLLAIVYLEKQNIKSDFLPNEDWVLGKTVIPPLRKTDGSYEKMDDGGYQIILNYRHPDSLAKEVTITDVLNNKINPNLIKDKLVIIGHTASSTDRGVATPYSSLSNQPFGTPSVFIQAQTVSQILSTVLDGKRQIWYLEDWQEAFWILIWSAIGGFVTWNFRRWQGILLAFGTVSFLYIICFLAFAIQSFWLPFIPPILGLFLTGGVAIAVFKFYQLPILSQRILKDYRKNSTVAQQTIEPLIIKTLTSWSNHHLQKIAVTALIDIIIDIFHNCQTLGEIADIPHQLAWIPSPVPKEVSTAIPQFLNISEDVWASYQATTPYRRSELLKHPIETLQTLKNSLAFERNPQIASNLRRINDKWLIILQTAQLTLEENSQHSREIRQVYIAGNALDPETAKYRFKGRIDIFREIEALALVEQPPVLLMYGGRRTGKTSTLKYLPSKLGSSLVPLLIDLQGAASATTLGGLAKNVQIQMLEAARRLPRRLDLPYLNLDETDPFITLQNWLGEIERIHPNKRFLLCLDEFERLSEVVETTGSRTPLNFLRNILQHRRQWILLFSGSHLVSELPSYWNDYLINTRTVRVSFLDEESARELIVAPVENFPLIYTKEAVDEIIKLTHCQPYLVQLMCYEVVEFLNREIRTNEREASSIKASLKDINAVILTVLERGDQYFRELWTSLSDPDRDLLRRIIQKQSPTPQDKGIIKKLVRREILTEESNTFRVPLIQKFIEQIVEEI
jgi:uncharacterized protein